MSEFVARSESSDQFVLSELVDELSARLKIRGLSSITAEDLDRLSMAAAKHENGLISSEASKLRRKFELDTGPSSIESCDLIARGLEQIRTLINNAFTQSSNSMELRSFAVRAEALPGESGSLAADEELILEFIAESREHLSQIESHMLLLERDHSATEALNSVFRAFHTIKGLAGFLDFKAIQSLAHEVETLLDLARSSRLKITPGVADVVLESTDVVRAELAHIQQGLSGDEPRATNISDALLQRIKDVANAQAEVSSSQVHCADPQIFRLTMGELPDSDKIALMDPARVTTTVLAEAHSKIGGAKGNSEALKYPGNSSVRVDTAKLDLLMEMVGEMAIAQSVFIHSAILTSAQERPSQELAQLSRATAEVQRIATSMRMVPIGSLFQKTARIVRDLSRRAGKRIVLETQGDDIELDKSIAEELADPLLHMVRNSIDHGIESPEERVAFGKDVTARIQISAYHESSYISISITDDGRGLNRDKILAKAKKNGIIGDDSGMSDTDVYALIFERGFSTADKVTDISGRGVGMDVVQRHVQRLRGRISIQSTMGIGTSFYLKLPLTLAIIEGLTALIGDQRYTVPITAVREMIRAVPAMISTVHGREELVLVRNTLLPVIRLHQHFNIKSQRVNLCEGLLLVAESEGKRFCLFVDDLTGKQEIVIKSLGPCFKQLPGIAGCAILGDGRVGLILDIDGIYRGRT